MDSISKHALLRARGLCNRQGRHPGIYRQRDRSTDPPTRVFKRHRLITIFTFRVERTRISCRHQHRRRNGTKSGRSGYAQVAVTPEQIHHENSFNADTLCVRLERETAEVALLQS